jgi:hypothetical protein
MRSLSEEVQDFKNPGKQNRFVSEIIFTVNNKNVLNWVDGKSNKIYTFYQKLLRPNNFFYFPS